MLNYGLCLFEVLVVIEKDFWQMVAEDDKSLKIRTDFRRAICIAI